MTGAERMNLLFIYNPTAGKAKIKNNLHEIVDVFVRNGYTVTVHPTQEAGDAMKAVKNRPEYYFDLVVCGGGDGTLDEVVTGMMQCEQKIPIGYIPAGSTNDFAGSLELSNDMVKAAEDIVNGKIFPCDVGMFNGKPFVYIAAFGLFTEVSYATNQQMKNLMGHMAYVLEGVKSLSAIKTYKMKIESEEMTTEGEYIYGMITNSLSVGGFKNITGNDVELDDGKFEVLLVRTPNNLTRLSEIGVALLNGTFDAPCIDYFKTSRLNISCEDQVDWTLDGEFGGKQDNVTIENRQRAIQIIVGQSEGETDESFVYHE